MHSRAFSDLFYGQQSSGFRSGSFHDIKAFFLNSESILMVKILIGFASGGFHQDQLQSILEQSESSWMVKICLALPPAVFIKLNFKAYYESVMMVKNHLVYYMF